MMAKLLNTRQNEKHPNEGDLWEIYFLVKYNYIQSRGVDDIKRRGYRLSGVDSFDESIDTEEIVSEMTIDSMFELWRNRKLTIKVVHYNDTAKIYEIIHRHIQYCLDYMQHAVNMNPIIAKDIADLDRFAMLVYNKAVPVFTERDRNQLDAGLFADFDPFKTRDIFKKENDLNPFYTSQPTIERREYQAMERSPFEEEIARHMAEIGGWKNNGG